MEEVYHIPALLEQSLEALDIKPSGVYVDATYGGGGHSRAIVERLSGDGHLYSFDQDEDAIRRGMKDARMTLVYSNFRYLTNFLRFYGVDGVDGILADLGVSFHHFDATERGFTFRDPEAPLDMRMNRHSETTASTLLETMSAEQLAEIFKLYGELPQSRRLAEAIVKSRGQRPLLTTGDLMAVVEPLLNPRQTKKDLACIYQALRIVVNDELGALKSFLNQTVKVLKPGGRLAVITYHSLEDRLVKNFIKTGNIEGRVEQDFYGHRLSPMKMLGSRPITPDAEETSRNPRSRSAKLRVGVKL